jgi:hypothetical protein
MGSAIMILKEKAGKIHQILSTAYPDVKTQLDFKTPFQLLVATILSAQCTDKQVNRVTPALFLRLSSPRDFAEADIETIEKLIRPTGFYHNKARNIRLCSEMLVNRFHGRVPDTIEELIQLARAWGIADYPAPAGGCLLTETVYSSRLKDLFDHGADCSENALHLLKYGRHIRLNGQVKIIVGRTLQDNTAILDRHDPSRDLVIKTTQIPGPVVLIPLGAGNDEILQAASICAGYSKAPENSQMSVEVISPGNVTTLWIARMRPESIQSMMIC